MNKTDKIVEDLFWADDQGCVRFISNQVGLCNLQRAVSQIVELHNKEIEKSLQNVVNNILKNFSDDQYGKGELKSIIDKL